MYIGGIIYLSLIRKGPRQVWVDHQNKNKAFPNIDHTSNYGEVITLLTMREKLPMPETPREKRGVTREFPD